MYIKSLRCYVCGEEYPRTQMWYRCECGGGLEIIYDISKLKKQVSWKKLRSRPFDHWRYEEFFPTVAHRISLSEGGTPLVRSVNTSTLRFKLESCNPTGSFKDRGSTIEISHAKDFGEVDVVCASTGNMGASVSAYCARAQLPCEIILPKNAAGAKIDQIRSYGSQVTPVDGDYTLAMTTAYKEYQVHGRFLVGDYAFRGEGEKSVGFEIADQCLVDDKRMPDFLIVPVGNGTLISGIWKGLKEMKACGLIKTLPKLIGVQAKGCNPIEKAYRTGKGIDPQLPHTIAGAIACGDPLDGQSALIAIKESKGKMIAVSDEEILSARRHLSEKEGIDGEPAGICGYAAWKNLKLSRYRCVIVICGHGLKDLEHR